LIHIDLSHNEIKEDACRQISKFLKNNHSIYGIHMAGN